MHYFSGKGCSESLESMHYCIGILRKSPDTTYLVDFPVLMRAQTSRLPTDKDFVPLLLIVGIAEDFLTDTFLITVSLSEP